MSFVSVLPLVRLPLPFGSSILFLDCIDKSFMVPHMRRATLTTWVLLTMWESGRPPKQRAATRACQAPPGWLPSLQGLPGWPPKWPPGQPPGWAPMWNYHFRSASKVTIAARSQFTSHCPRVCWHWFLTSSGLTDDHDHNHYHDKDATMTTTRATRTTAVAATTMMTSTSTLTWLSASKRKLHTCDSLQNVYHCGQKGTYKSRSGKLILLLVFTKFVDVSLGTKYPRALRWHDASFFQFCFTTPLFEWLQPGASNQNLFHSQLAMVS